MTPFEKKMEEIAITKMNKEKNVTCKNGVFLLEADKEKGIYKTVNDGCKNLRRNGSAFCQECSDTFNKK